MPRTRREFLQTTAGLAAGMMGMTAAGETPASQLQTLPASQNGSASGIAMSSETSCVQVPKMKFGGAEIGRLVLGCNPMNGGAHFNATYSGLMREWLRRSARCR